MAESDRPSSSSGGRRRIPLQQTRSSDATCIFEMEGLDFEDVDSLSSVNSLTSKSPFNSRSRNGNGSRRISDSNNDRNDDEDYNNNNDSDDGDGDNGKGSNNTHTKINNNNNRVGRKRETHNASDGFKDDDDDDDGEEEEEDDDEELEDYESDPRNLFQRLTLNSKCTRQFATSLPIQVPLWKSSSLNQETDDTDSEQNATCDEDLRKIAESFRALAWSVKDGTEMFGDLPRHRLKSRPI